jgi:hypothetical protein
MVIDERDVSDAATASRAHHLSRDYNLLFVGKCFFTVDIIIPLGALAPGHFSEV